MTDPPEPDVESIEQRLSELRPVVEEYRRLQAAREALAHIARGRRPGEPPNGHGGSARDDPGGYGPT